jgi:hypothetical protein
MKTILNRTQVLDILSQAGVPISRWGASIEKDNQSYSLGFSFDRASNLIRLEAFATNPDRHGSFLISHAIGLRAFHLRKLKKIYSLPVGKKKSTQEALIDYNLKPILEGVFEVFDNNDFDYLNVHISHNKENNKLEVYNTEFSIEPLGALDFVEIKDVFYHRHYKIMPLIENNGFNAIAAGVYHLTFNENAKFTFIGHFAFLSFLLQNGVSIKQAYFCMSDFSKTTYVSIINHLKKCIAENDIIVQFIDNKNNKKFFDIINIFDNKIFVLGGKVNVLNKKRIVNSALVDNLIAKILVCQKPV